MANQRKKVSVIGSGFTGATTAFLLAQKELADVVLVDIPTMENPTKGKALDMLEASPVQGFDASIIGTSNYEDTANSDIVIITAGIARKPGMSRDDLVQTNQKVMQSVTKDIVKYSPDTIILVLTNPVDAMTYTVYKESGLPKEKVIGQSGVLDTARFRTFVAQE
ncbi:MAG TPA: malate dehydrogenase, partial [Savagea sp.]